MRFNHNPLTDEDRHDNEILADLVREMNWHRKNCKLTEDQKAVMEKLGIVREDGKLYSNGRVLSTWDRINTANQARCYKHRPKHRCDNPNAERLEHYEMVKACEGRRRYKEELKERKEDFSRLLAEEIQKTIERFTKENDREIEWCEYRLNSTNKYINSILETARRK